MLFNSYTFILFFTATTAAFWCCPRWPQRKLVLLVASYLFYAAWNPPYVLLLIFCTSLDWWLARGIARSLNHKRARVLLGISLICNLGLLGYFKYGNFFEANFAALGNALGVAWHAGQDGVLLPIGISFYTFASLS